MKRKAPICSIYEKDWTHKPKTNDMPILQTPDTFTLYKHKNANNFKHQKCERVDLFFLRFNWTTVSSTFDEFQFMINQAKFDVITHQKRGWKITNTYYNMLDFLVMNLPIEVETINVAVA